MWAAGHADRVAGNVEYVTMQTDVLNLLAELYPTA